MVFLKELIFKYPLWVGVAVLKELIYNSFYFGGGCGGFERTDFFLTVTTLGEGVVILKELIFNSFYFEGRCGGLERTDFKQFLLWVGVVILKELNF